MTDQIEQLARDFTDTKSKLTDRTDRLEREFIKLTATLQAYAKAAAVGALVLAGLIGVTALVGVPAAAQKALEDGGAAAAVAAVKTARASSEEELKAIQRSSSEAASVVKRLNSGRLKLESECGKSGGACPLDTPPACTAGFIDSGLVVNNTWAGGGCGEGYSCRVCYKFDTP